MNLIQILFCILSTSCMIILTKAAEVEVKAIYNEEQGYLVYQGQQYSLTVNHLEVVEKKEMDSSAFWMNISFILFFTLFAGAMSGLTVGYLSIDDLVLELKSKTGTDIEQKYSNRILPIINKRHWLLVTLLLFNATAMEALPLFLNRIVDEYFAIIISVTLVLFFGEIIPQALCTGPSQLQIASTLATMTKGLMYVSFPISFPIAKLLDHLVGKHSKSRFVNTDLKGLIELHTLEALAKLSKEQGHSMEQTHEIGLRNEQADLMISALEIKERKALELMIPLDKVFMIDSEEPLDANKVNLILSKGYSRIPVFNQDRNHIVGILRIKQLIGVDVCSGKSISQHGIKLTAPIVVDPNTPALDLLGEFRKGKSHMSFLTHDVQRLIEILAICNSDGYRPSIRNRILKDKKQQPVRVLGMVTLEDVLEKMINIEILDEDDYARNKILHEKKGVSNKNRFYKNAITRELAMSFVEDNKEKLSMIVENSYRNGTMFLDRMEKDNSMYEDTSVKLREPLL
jgi:metal transporter CNNM